MALNYVDYVILAILLVFAIRGYLKGIIVGLATIAALVLGLWAALHFSNFLDATLAEHLHPSRKWLPILSFTLTFLLVVLGVMLTAKITEKFVDMVGMGFFNHLGGAILGIAKGAILAGVLLFIITAVDTKGRLIPLKDRKESFFQKQAERLFPMVSSFTAKALNR